MRSDLLDGVKCPDCEGKDLDRIRPIETETATQWLLKCLSCGREIVI
jgi:DNA-directed RNA polymerase subunit RPC12/RpoP